MILTELAPLTPERASSTLSRMYCEKLKLIPGNFLNFSISSFSMSSRLIVWSQSLWPKSMNGLFRHSSIGFKGAPISRLKKPVTSVPSSGRPSCEITRLDLGNRGDHARASGAPSWPRSRARPSAAASPGSRDTLPRAAA